MSIVIGIEIPQAGSGQFLRFEFAEDKTGVLPVKERIWRLIPPYPPNYRDYVPLATGTWKVGLADQIFIMNGSQELFLLRQTENAFRFVSDASGHAFCGLEKNGQYKQRTRWKRLSKPLPQRAWNSGVWVGYCIKGAASAGVGLELPLVVAYSLENLGKGMHFFMPNIRLGAIGGASAGFGIAIITGVPTASELENHFQSGVDWALSLGNNWAAGVKYLSEAGHIVKLKDFLGFCARHADDALTLGKSLISGFNMDWEEKQVTILDLPGGPGIEVGVYLNGGFCKCVRQFIGHPYNIIPDLQQVLESMKQSKLCAR